MQCNKNKAFTLMEIMTVIIIIGLMAGFSLPNFQKAIQKGQERSAILNLQAIYTASEYYKSNNNNNYFVGTKIGTNINTTFGLNLLSDGWTYQYVGTATTFTVTATRGGIQLRINQTSINPCCSNGTCVTVTNCT